MAVTSYSTLKTAIADWLDRDDIDSVIEDFIDLMEARLYRDLRIRFMESSLSVTLSSGTATVPSDYLELRHAYIDGSPAQKLEVKSPDWIYGHYPQRSSDAKPGYIARDDDSFIFGPFPDSDYTLKGIYYAKPTALSTSNETNWLITHAPDLLLYGALVHSSAYIGQDERLVMWEAGYQEAFRRVTEQDDEERFPAQIPIAASYA